MRSRLAMVSCKGPHTTPWMLPQGGECRLRILHMMDGEKVVLLEEGVAGEKVYNSVGEFPFHPEGKFCFAKHRDAEVLGSPTIVEVLYNG